MQFTYFTRLYIHLFVTFNVLQICRTNTTTVAYTPSSEKLLIKHLSEIYNRVGKIGRPVKNVSQTITVAYGLSLFQLLDLDEKEQILTTNVWNKFTWKDELLTWDPEKYDGLTSLRIPVKYIWSPDIVLYNFADFRTKELREVLLLVDYTGTVFWSPPSIYKSICRIDMKYFPFDHQVCYLRFASWTQDGKRLELTFFENRSEVSLLEYRVSNEWELVASPAIKRHYKQSCCDNEFSNLIFFFVLKRNPAFYAYLLVLPCLLLASLNLVTFWMPPQVPARMLLGMNIFVGFCILMKFLTKSTPSASNTIPYLGYYCCLNMVLIAMSTFISLIAVNLHFRRNTHRPIPKWLKNVTQIGARLLRLEQGPLQKSKNVKIIKDYEERTTKQLQENSRNITPMMPIYCPHCSCKCTSLFSTNRCNTETELTCGYCKNGSKMLSKNINMVNHATTNNNNKTLTESSTKRLESNLGEIKKVLQNFMNDVTAKDKAEKVAGEWALVAMTIDRFCFWIFFLGIVSSGLGMLVPTAYSYQKEDLIQQFDEWRLN